MKNPNKTKPKNNSRWQVFTFSGHEVVLLKALRDKVAHARDHRDGDVPERFKEDFRVTYDSYHPAKFVEVFVTKFYPNLLIDLYNIYKGNEYGCIVDFYP